MSALPERPYRACAFASALFGVGLWLRGEASHLDLRIGFAIWVIANLLAFGEITRRLHAAKRDTTRPAVSATDNDRSSTEPEG